MEKNSIPWDNHELKSFLESPYYIAICSKRSKVQYRMVSSANPDNTFLLITLKRLYNSLFLPYITYCTLFQTSTCCTLKFIPPVVLSKCCYKRKLFGSILIPLHLLMFQTSFKASISYLFTQSTNFKSLVVFLHTTKSLPASVFPPCFNSILNANWSSN